MSSITRPSDIRFATPTPALHCTHTQHVASSPFPVCWHNVFKFYLYIHHVRDCTRYLAHARTALYHKPSTRPGVSRSASPLACTPFLHPFCTYEKPRLLTTLLLAQFCSGFDFFCGGLAGSRPDQMIASVLLCWNHQSLSFLFFVGTCGFQNFWYWLVCIFPRFF